MTTETPPTPAAAEPTTPAAPTATRESTIQDAIDQLFASKPETPKPAETEAPAAADAAGEPAEAAPADADAPAEVPAEPAKPAEPPAKVSAADYAIQLAKAKKKLAAATPPKPTVAAPSADAIKRAAMIEAAGGDPLKAFEAAGLDLAAVVKAYEERLIKEPDNPDPLAVEVKSLAEKLSLYEKREEAAKDAAAKSQFLAEASRRVQGNDEFEYVAAHGAEGLELVAQLVLQAAADGEVLLIGDALKEAEAHYSEDADKLAKTKKLAAKFKAVPRRPSIPQQAPAAGTAPTKPTKPKTTLDVIEHEIDALLGAG